jgi:hypothetical protein
MLGSASPSRFQYVSFGDNDLERVDVINDHGVLIDSKMTFVNHIESIVSKSARMLVFIKRISRRFPCKTMYGLLSGRGCTCIVHVLASSGGLFGKD